MRKNHRSSGVRSSKLDAISLVVLLVLRPLSLLIQVIFIDLCRPLQGRHYLKYPWQEQPRLQGWRPKNHGPRCLLLGKVLGLMVLGTSVGIFTALIVVALSRAWLEVRSGKLQGTEFILDKFMGEKSHAAILGSNVMKSDIAIPDPDIAPQHARLKGAGNYFTLQDMSVGKGTFVNGRKVEKHRLKNRETIRLGSTEIVYHEKR